MNDDRLLVLETQDLVKAAELWALAHSQGFPTADSQSLDADVILAAQAINLNSPVIVATTNPGHLSRYVNAALWSDINL